jgi:hypothetical protein
MDTERKWEAIAPRAFTANGGQFGTVTVASTVGFKVKQNVIIKGDSLLDLVNLEVKSVLSETLLEVGKKGDIQDRFDLTAYTLAANATIEAPKQDRSKIDIKEHERAVYAEEPIMAKRVIPVDRIGNYFHEGNPFPVKVNGITIENIDVALSHNGEKPQPNNGDTVAIGNNKTGADSHLLEVYPSKDIDIRRQGTTVNQKIANALRCMDDKLVAYTWGEINGVRRVTKIEWTSAALDAQEGSTIKLTRTFTYQGVDPFDLVSTADALSVI